MNRSNRVLRKSALSMALGLCFAFALPAAHAGNSDGSVLGRTGSGATVTVTNPETGFTRSVTADADGNYRFPFLPVGNYSLSSSAADKPVPVTVNLGVATTVNIGASEGTLSTIVVTAGAIQAVDVTSMESATNINKTELERIPVERDPLAVALLAPGVIEGEFGGISFGGSSVAENTVYINGLNVTDFYNRVGFSSVPYSFYKEFQIKTGGYSVEFGRTTGGVINAVTQSGTNEFKFGAEAVWEPSFLQTEGSDHYDADGNPYYISSYDEYERRNLNVYASGPIVKDKLFFYALYEARDYQPSNTTSTGNLLNEGDADDGFWGTKLDWQINDNHLLEFLGFGDSNSTATDIYQFDLASGNRGEYSNTRFIDNGGTNWSATYTGYLTDSFSMKAMYGENEREFAQSSLNDINCNRIRDRRDVGNGDIG